MPVSSDSAALRLPSSLHRLLVPAIAALGALGLFACSSGKQLTKEESCQEKWEKAKAKFEKKKTVQTKEVLSDVVSSCPGSSFTEEAMFDLAESHMALEEWDEAEQEFSSFLKDFPNSKRYGQQAMFRKAVANGNQAEIPARDQSKTLDAIADYENFLDEYPEGPYADTAKIELGKLKDILVAKEMQIARLYRRMGEPQAAAIYYKNILKEYGDKVDIRDINLKLAHCYIAMGQFDEAETYLSKFDGVAKDDPFKKKVMEAYKDLEKARTKMAAEKKEEQEQGKRQEAL
jgi:outer membrane protein assembly factor BamD